MTTSEEERMMNERFGKENVIALATIDRDSPAVRNVNAYYENGAFYIITYALSDKMRQIAVNSDVAVSGEWFTARGTAENIGWFKSRGNAEIAEKLRTVFSEWIDNGHNNFDDQNTIILKIKLRSAVLFSMGTRYDICFQ